MSTIDKIRKSAINLSIQDEADSSGIEELISIGKNLYLVTRNAVYGMQLADEIDPERTNINVPKASYKKILIQGSDDPIVGKILLTAKKLFDEKLLGSSIDCVSLLEASLKLSELIIEMDIIKNSVSEKIEAIQKTPIRPQDDGSIKLPVTTNLVKDCESFIKQFDSVRDQILKIFEIFYPTNRGKNEKERVQNILKKIEERSAQNSLIVQFFTDLSKSLFAFRNWRNALEHPDADKKVIIRDFELTKEVQISTPSIEILHKETPQARMEITKFLSEVVEELTSVTEIVIAQTCSQNFTSSLVCGVIQVPLEVRQNKFVQFSYATKLGDEIHPLG